MELDCPLSQRPDTHKWNSVPMEFSAGDLEILKFDRFEIVLNNLLTS